MKVLGQGYEGVLEDLRYSVVVVLSFYHTKLFAQLRQFDPFLLLDEFKVKKPAGFPDHPHRGFETVTYMINGSFQHEDFCGHKGTINAGDLQVEFYCTVMGSYA